MMHINNTALGDQARDTAKELLNLNEHLKHVQEVCSALDLNQSSSGMETMVCIAQSSDLITKSASLVDSMANLLDPLLAFYAEIAEQSVKHAGNTPLWITAAQETLKKKLG
jgi:hypothetical protein